MSVRVMNEVFERSMSTAVTRLVLLAIADQASDDGVAWLPVDSDESEKKTIAKKARCSRATAFRAIESLVEAGELQVVKVRRGRSTISVYRVVVGRISRVPVDYDRLPFDLPHPFGSPSHFETVATVSSETVQGLKSERSGSQSAISVLSIDLDPLVDPLEIQGQHPEIGEGDPDPRLLAMRLVSNNRGVRAWLRNAGHHYAESPRDFASEALEVLGARDGTIVEEYRQFAAADTPRQAYERWIDETTDLPLDEISAVIKTWDDLDDVERQELLERAEHVRAATGPGKRAAA